MIRKTSCIALLGAVSLSATAQTPTPNPPTPTTHTGCVTATPDDAKSFVLSDESGCSLLSGKMATARLAGHIIVLRGSLSDATLTDPQMILIDTIQSLGAACQQTCTLEPPGHRGLHRKEKTGSPGGTPGS